MFEFSSRIRIHMIHLYQRKDINKDIARTKQLNRCRISLRLCINEDGKYIGVSSVWNSNVIEDRKRFKFDNLLFRISFVCCRCKTK